MSNGLSAGDFRPLPEVIPEIKFKSDREIAEAECRAQLRDNSISFGDTIHRSHGSNDHPHGHGHSYAHPHSHSKGGAPVYGLSDVQPEMHRESPSESITNINMPKVDGRSPSNVRIVAEYNNADTSTQLPPS